MNAVYRKCTFDVFYICLGESWNDAQEFNSKCLWSVMLGLTEHVCK